MLFRSVADFVGSGFKPQVLVVGTGPAGLSLASRLQDKRVPSLLIEAGGYEASEASQDCYRGTVVADSAFELHRTRLRQFGGTSGLWSGWCRALDALDFEARADIPHSGWPIRKTDLDPHAPAAADILQIKPTQTDRALTPDLDEIEIRFSPPVRLGTDWRARVERSQTVGLLLDTTVKELVPGDARIDAIKVADAAQEEFDLPVKWACVCAGGVENSRLLLWSNARHRGRVVANAGALGRYWMEHPRLRIGDAVLFDGIESQFARRRFFATSEPARKARTIGAARLWVQPLQDEPSASRALVRQALCAAPALSARLLDLAGRELHCGAALWTGWEQTPRMENRIELMAATDSFGVPRARLHCHKSALDRKTVLVSAQLFGEALIRLGLGRLRIRDWLLDGAPFPNDDTAGRHHIGGTRMAESAAAGVVDRDCKVFGMSNLYVGGSSVFPTCGQANPTFTIVQLALRLGDHLAGVVANAG